MEEASGKPRWVLIDYTGARPRWWQWGASVLKVGAQDPHWVGLCLPRLHSSRVFLCTGQWQCAGFGRSRWQRPVNGLGDGGLEWAQQRRLERARYNTT